MLDLDPMKDRVSKATPGPWGRVQDDDGDCFVYTPVGPISVGPDDGVRGSFDLADADLIAHAPTDLADLIAEVEWLRKAEAIANRKWGICVSQSYKVEADHEALAAEVHRLRAQAERVRATLDPEDANPINDAYARGFAHHSRNVREALEGTDDETE